METEQDLIQGVETASSSSDVSRSSAVTLSSDPAASPSTTGLSSQQSCCANASEDDKPPEYDNLSQRSFAIQQQQQLAVSAAFSTPKSVEEARETHLTTEAPPAYDVLFRDAAGQSRGGGWGGIFGLWDYCCTLGGRTSSNRLQGENQPRGWKDKAFNVLKVAFLTVVFLMAYTAALGCPLTMITVGFKYFYTCTSFEIPLYLIVAGFLVIAEITFHSLVCLGEHHSEHPNTFRGVRKCDVIACLLFIWLLLGSNWIFRLPQSTGDCPSTDGSSSGIDVIRSGTSTSDENEVPTGNINSTNSTSATTSCRGDGDGDCRSGVYIFAFSVMMLQYLLFFLVLLGCCSNVLRKRRSQ